MRLILEGETMQSNERKDGTLTRRRFIAAGGAGAAGLAIGGWALGRATASSEPVRADLVLRPRPSEVEIGGRQVATWTYDGGLPGPAVRLRQGRPVRIRVDNDLPEPTTVHWHGIRLRENDADGVPGLTQTAIEPGGSYMYEFTPPDAGTFFFHSHVGMQLDRGLYAPLIVEATNETLDYDREAVLILDDWLDGVRGTPDEQLEALRSEGMAHGMGGMGPAPGEPFGPVRGPRPSPGVAMANLALAGGVDAGDVDHPLHLINGRPPEAPFQVDVRRGERVRLRFVNAAADTIYAVFVEGHELRVTHADGLAVEPVTTDALLMGMAERFDALIEPRGEGGARVIAVPLGKAGRAVANLRLADSRARTPAPDAPVRPPRRLLTHADLTGAEMEEATPRGDRRTIDMSLAMDMREPYLWSIGGQSMEGSDEVQIARDEPVRFVFANRTMMPHPMHLHGHSFRPVRRGEGLAPLKDTILVAPMETLAVDWTADNPGDWALHCHNGYHHEAGMMRHIKVA
ncbi:MAG: multicopper oxidase family protein [Actinomycetota bacterium]|nr:multicopper oxidase family protein [Actinomycetota bacterium]